MSTIFKAELTIPVEQYGNIRPTVEGTAQDIVDAYFEFSRMVKPKEGISDKDFNAFIDRQMMGEANHMEEYQRMSPDQQKTVQTIKRALNRIEAKQNKQ